MICNKCNKPSEFYRRKNGAIVRPCKDCMSKAAQEWGNAHPEQRKNTAADFRERHRETIRAQNRERIAENPERNRQRVREWKQSHPSEHQAQARRWISNNPERAAIAQSASNSVRKAIRAGLLTRPNNCGRCGIESEHIEASHDDYSKPLEVEWLCRPCHRRKDALNPNTLSLSDGNSNTLVSIERR